MRVRRLIPALSVCLAASVSIAVAQPKDAPKKEPAAPAKDAPPGTPGTTPGGDAGQMSEDAPPQDIEGKEENPNAPKIIGEETPVVVKQAEPKRTGYPIEEAMRPITLPRNMAEISIDPHAQFSSFRASTALRARYGITEQVQIGLTYMLFGVFDPDRMNPTNKIGLHPGKAVGLDVTVQLKSWLGVKVGVPVYIDPLALALTLGAPMKWQFADGKYALGALDDLLEIRLYRFVPSFYQEFENSYGALGEDTDTAQSRGNIRFSGYGIMQYRPNTALFGRIGVAILDFSTTRSTAGVDHSGLKSSIRAGVQHTLRKNLDVGFSLGIDDLAHGGSFGPAGLLAFRI